MHNSSTIIGIISDNGFMDLLEKHKYFSFYKKFFITDSISPKK